MLDAFRNRKVKKSPEPKPSYAPKGEAGRGHTEGWLDLEEFNNDLKHPHGHRVYDKMYRTDGDVRQVVQLICNPIIAGTWAVVPYGGEHADDEAQDIAAFIKWALFEAMSPNLLQHLQSMLPILVRSGFVPFEKIWKTAEYTPVERAPGKEDGERMKKEAEQKAEKKEKAAQEMQKEQLKAQTDIAKEQEKTKQKQVAKKALEAIRKALYAGTITLAEATAMTKQVVTESKGDDAERNSESKRTVVVPRTLSVRLPRTIEKFEQDEWGELRRIKQWLPVPRTSLTAREGGPLKDEPQRPEGPSYVWLDAENLIYYRIGAEGDNWEGVSLLRPAYKHWLYKDKIERIDAIAQEREALGIPICYPPLGADERQLDEIELVLQAMRANEQAYIVAPGPKAAAGAPEGQGWLFEVIGYDRTGSGRDPQPSLEYHTLKIAASFIAEFMRLGHGQTGARATAQVQADPFQMSVEALVGIVEQQLNTLVREIVRVNYGETHKVPKLQMSLVDSTSLSQLADYVQKLTQIGALLPDQELEDFLRARADLPPANPASIEKRKDKDDETRRMIVTGGTTSAEQAEAGAEAPGGPPKGDPFGANAPVGKHGTKDAPQKTQSGGGAASNRSRDDEAITLNADFLPPEEGGPRPRHRDLRWLELTVDWDALEDEMDALPERAIQLCGDHVFGKACGADVSDTEMHDALARLLNDAYDYGYNSVVEEVAHQRELAGLVLDRGAVDRGRKHLDQRVELAVEFVNFALRQAKINADLIYGHDSKVQLAVEQAGLAALKAVGRDHAVNSLLLGRHDAGRYLDEEDDSVRILGVRYSAVLDKGTCGPCAESDDGRLRRVDDPVRLDRRPPNRHCDSTASGFNRCRCTEVYEVQPENAFSHNLGVALDDGGLHPYLARVATALMARGMDSNRAVSTALGIAKTHCTSGRINWPGIRAINPGSRSEACEALAQHGYEYTT
jgi:hypothetical protein